MNITPKENHFYIWRERGEWAIYQFRKGFWYYIMDDEGHTYSTRPTATEYMAKTHWYELTLEERARLL